MNKFFILSPKNPRLSIEPLLKTNITLIIQNIYFQSQKVIYPIVSTQKCHKKCDNKKYRKRIDITNLPLSKQLTKKHIKHQSNWSNKQTFSLLLLFTMKDQTYFPIFYLKIDLLDEKCLFLQVWGSFFLRLLCKWIFHFFLPCFSCGDSWRFDLEIEKKIFQSIVKGAKSAKDFLFPTKYGHKWTINIWFITTKLQHTKNNVK